MNMEKQERKELKKQKLSKSSSQQLIVHEGTLNTMIEQSQKPLDQKLSRIEYEADLRWLQQPYSVRRKFKKGCISVPSRMHSKQVRQAIINDLQQKGMRFRYNFKMKVVDIQIKKYKPNFLMRYFLGEKRREIKVTKIICIVFEKKINLSSEYKYKPETFEGFKVKNLFIENSFGCILWEGQTDISSINFDIGLEIRKEEVQCDIPQLQKPAILQFYSLPERAKGLSIEKVDRMLKKAARGAELVSFDIVNEKWVVRVDFGEQLEEPERQENGLERTTY